MSVNLRDQVAFITGASSGIGRATALALAAEGCRLVLTARTLARLNDTVDAAHKAGAADVMPLAFDIRTRSEVEAAIASLPEPFAAIRILVNNAGLARGLEKLWQDDPENWEEMIDTNTRGLLYATRAIVPGMVQRNAGHVVSLGSTAGWMAYAGGSVYCATKAAERSIMEGLRIDLMGTAVRVTSIDPGMVKTDFSEVRFHGDKDRAAKIYQNITPLQPEDVADAIRYAVTRPAHVNVSSLLLTSIDQANSVTFNRRTA